MIKNGMRPIHPGEILREDYMKPYNISANSLADALGVTASRVNDIARERRGITGDTALRLAHCFGGDAQSWLNLQSQYDLRLAEIAAGERITFEVHKLFNDLGEFSTTQAPTKHDIKEAGNSGAYSHLKGNYAFIPIPKACLLKNDEGINAKKIGIHLLTWDVKNPQRIGYRLCIPCTTKDLKSRNIDPITFDDLTNSNKINHRIKA